MSDVKTNHDTELDIDPDAEERDDAIIALALKRSLQVFLLLIVLAGLVYVLTRPDPVPLAQEAPLAAVEVRTVSEVEVPHVSFADITDEAGIDFVHENGATGDKLLPETMGGGCAFFDFDNDGDQDLLFVNSQRWPWDTSSDDASAATPALYENDGSGHFEDVTSGSGLDISLYGMGVAVGDYDGDGRVDVYLTAVGPNRLFHNAGDGQFVDVTAETGVAGGDQEWGTSCGWFDYDRDGDLDLFVCNYLKWSREFDAAQNFQLTGGGRAYGRPQNFEGTFPYLYRNDGDGQFEEVAQKAGLQIRNPATNVPIAKSLGVSFADFDADGWLDILVANDTIQNFLFHNQQDGTFNEVGASAGVAFDMDGNARGAMGIDVAPFRNSQALGVAIGNFSNEMTALYVADSNHLVFMDQAISTGLGPNTRLQLTFGLFFLDIDLDSRLDLFAANGHLEDEINRVQASQTYEQSPQLFWNCGPKAATEFRPMTKDQVGADFIKPLVGRGASYADIDGDGDLDIVLTTVGRRPRLLRNDQQLDHHWLRVRLEGSGGNSDAIGAWVEVLLPGDDLRRQVMPTKSYASQVELPLTFGLGEQDQVEEAIVHWPDGSVQTVISPGVDTTITIRQSDDG